MRLLSMMLFLLSLSVAGCSHLSIRPLMARYQVNDPSHGIKDVVVDLDVPLEKKLDIRINDRYAVQFDLLFNANPNSNFTASRGSMSSASLQKLTPYLLCKYRF